MRRGARDAPGAVGGRGLNEFCTGGIPWIPASGRMPL